MVIPSTSHKEEVMKLIAKKEQIERSINDCGQILLANKNVGMTESLLDSEGFPRDDIDVYAVRQARHQIICLQNDLKSTMKEIEDGLVNVHTEARTNHATTTKMANMEISPDITPEGPSRRIENTCETPILVVTSVMPLSPAEKCGIRKDDEILEFGSINHNNFKELKQISELVMHRQNQQIALKIKRQGRNHDITLVPEVWSGKGFLGCNIIIPNSTR
ncbi:26S proteasome non-ATPase regulatory subunit 9 [Contarinia nasturtii]|uniref:26S proteasome non-ATPase regulatory subunit 9 n=1 Tax=Contarinia nasturtii TaxID=265458 RepID=UPI0012D3A793|nr:26S proteasome non-ATPase regulatory subunit 9 [Contarinia nasturtii]